MSRMLSFVVRELREAAAPFAFFFAVFLLEIDS